MKAKKEAKKNAVNMGFTHEKFHEGTHMCLIYNNEEERREIISNYLDGGIATGEKVTYFADEMSPDQVKEWLADMGVQPPDNEVSDSFNVVTADSTYLPDGKFDPEKMLRNLRDFYTSAVEQNFASCRVSGEMSWALQDKPGTERLMEYEAKVNDVLVEYPVTAICQYDANKFDGATLFECLKVHPYMIVKGQIVRNPYYMSTDEYLKTIT